MLEVFFFSNNKILHGNLQRQEDLGSSIISNTSLNGLSMHNNAWELSLVVKSGKKGEKAVKQVRRAWFKSQISMPKV
jgi:hypothetical protein